MQKIVIFGAKAFAEIAHYYFTHDSPHTVAGFTVDSAYLTESTYNGLPVVPFEEVELHFSPDEYGMFVAIGFDRMNQLRATKVAQAEAKRYQIVSFVSSKADIATDLKILPNTMIMERAGIQPFVQIGKNTVIWSETRIGFHTRIGDNCWITCALFGESVTIGDYSFVGLNATIAPSVSIGRSNIIGAGALVVHDTKEGEIYRGRASKASRVPSDRLRHFRR
ncbi:MAG TPA: acetyltransferase [Planctomycetaceae bacterium]|jgi:sugar O-acyltransferase (sialic acid O-acetyltransferase NeuD family)|nr:acetyltransferase [Planctomycetaceae bacterium]